MNGANIEVALMRDNSDVECDAELITAGVNSTGGLSVVNGSEYSWVR